MLRAGFLIGENHAYKTFHAETSCTVSAYRWPYQVAAPGPATQPLHYDLFLPNHYWLSFGCFMSMECHFNQ